VDAGGVVLIDEKHGHLVGDLDVECVAFLAVRDDLVSGVDRAVVGEDRVEELDPVLASATVGRGLGEENWGFLAVHEHFDRARVVGIRRFDGARAGESEVPQRAIDRAALRGPLARERYDVHNSIQRRSGLRRQRQCAEARAKQRGACRGERRGHPPAGESPVKSRGLGSIFMMISTMIPNSGVQHRVRKYLG